VLHLNPRKVYLHTVRQTGLDVSQALASNHVNYSYSLSQRKVLETGPLNLKESNLLTLLPEVSIRELELAYMNFVPVGLHWSTLLV
jgi:hypothetical protein